MNHSKVSTSSSFSSFSAVSKDQTISINPVKETPQMKTDNEVIRLLTEDYKTVISSIKKHQKITLDVLRSRLPVDTKRHEDNVKILRRMIDGLNETLLEERIKVTELRKMIKGYKRDNLSLINDLRAHMAEVNYLTKVANGQSRDPSVVRKISKLEKRNRKLVSKYEKLRAIFLQTKRNLFSPWSKLSSSYEVLVDIKPSETSTSVSLIPEFNSLWLLDNETINNGLSSIRKLLHADGIFNVADNYSAAPIRGNEKRKIDKRLLSCLKNKRTSSSDDRTTVVTVRFDPEVKCCLSDSIDSKIFCKKRAEFIQESAYNLLSNREIKVPLLMQYFLNLWGGGR